MKENIIIIARVYDKPNADARLLRHIRCIAIELKRKKCYIKNNKIILLHTGMKDQNIPLVWKSISVYAPIIFSNIKNIIRKVAETILFNIMLMVILAFYSPKIIYVVNIDSSLALLMFPPLIRKKVLMPSEYPYSVFFTCLIHLS